MEDTIIVQVSVSPTQVVRKKPNMNKKPKPPDLMCEACTASICCPLLGIVALALTVSANSAADRGELQLAHSNAGIAGILIMIVWVCTMCFCIALVINYSF